MIPTEGVMGKPMALFAAEINLKTDSTRGTYKMTMQRRMKFTIAALLLILTGCVPNTDYGDIMMNAFKSALGGDFTEYQFRSYPVDNFGVLTMYDGSYDPLNYLCGTWSCLGVTSNQIPTNDMTALLTVNGYVDKGNGGNINLTTDQQTAMGLSVVVPQILGMLDVTGDVNWQKHVSIKLAATGGHQRFLIAQKLADYLNGLPKNDIRLRAYNNGTLTVVISDLVIDSMVVTIDIDSTWSGDLDAKLSKALAGKTGTVIGQGADLSYKVNSATTGHYEFQTVSSVIVAMLPKTEPKPPVAFAFGEIKILDFKTWGNTPIDLKNVKGTTIKPLQIQ
jgi:hypothetical protein